MGKPITISYTFGTQTGPIPLSYLDTNFTSLASAINNTLTYSNYLVDTGAANAYAVNFAASLTTSYTAGLLIQFRVANANTGASTINVNSLGAKSIVNTDGSALSSGQLRANAIATVQYDGTNFQLINATATGDITFSGNTISTSGTNQNIILDPNGTGAVLVNTATALYGSAAVEITAAGSNIYGLAVRSIADVREALAVWNNATSGNNAFVSFGTEGTFLSRGTITYNRGAGLVAYNTTSDYRCKDVYGPVTDSGAQVDALKVYRGKMHGATQERPMMVAHEAQAVAPYAVTGQKDAVNEHNQPVMQQIDYSTLVPLLVAEIQSLRARVAALGG